MKNKTTRLAALAAFLVAFIMVATSHAVSAQSNCNFTVGNATFSVNPGSSVTVDGHSYSCPADTAATAVPTAAPTMAATASAGTSTFKVTGAPASVSAAKVDPTYKNTIGLGTASWLGEPGVLTADPGDKNCPKNPSCWITSPDVQQKLTIKAGQGFDLREGGFTMFSLAGVTLEVNGTTIEADPSTNNTWLIFVTARAADSSQVDLNLPIFVSKFNPGFGLVTNLPPGARISEDYFDQNAATAHTKGNCGLNGCKSVSALFYDVNTGAWNVITQSTPNGAWVQVATNIAN